MNCLKQPWLKALVLSTLAVIILLVLGITTVTIPNAFFFLGAIAILVILAIIFDRCSFNCLRIYFLISALAVLIYVIVLSFFVTAGTLVLTLVPIWIGIFLILNLLFSFLSCQR